MHEFKRPEFVPEVVSPVNSLQLNRVAASLDGLPHQLTSLDVCPSTDVRDQLKAEDFEISVLIESGNEKLLRPAQLLNPSSIETYDDVSTNLGVISNHENFVDNE